MNTVMSVCLCVFLYVSTIEPTASEERISYLVCILPMASYRSLLEMFEIELGFGSQNSKFVAPLLPHREHTAQISARPELHKLCRLVIYPTNVYFSLCLYGSIIIN